MSSCGSTCRRRSAETRSRFAHARAARTPRGQDRREVERAQREPERRGGRSGPGALERDLAQVQVAAREVGVGRVVLVEPPDARVAEEDRAAAVGLEAVLVRVDDDAVGVGDRAEGRHRHELVEQGEEAAVRGVDVDPHAVTLAQRHRLLDGVDGAEPGRARGHDDRPDAARRAAASRSSVAIALDAEHGAHARVGVVGVGAERDRLARVQLARHPQRLEVGDRPGGRQVAERVSGKPNIVPRSRTTSTSSALVAGPPSSAWLLALTCIAAV